MTFRETMQYFTPTTLEAMYRDLEEAKTDVLNIADKGNLIYKAETYRLLTNKSIEISDQYEALTGNPLWVKVHGI